jgi:hypothetical protein
MIDAYNMFQPHMNFALERVVSLIMVCIFYLNPESARRKKKKQYYAQTERSSLLILQNGIADGRYRNTIHLNCRGSYSCIAVRQCVCRSRFYVQ